MPAQLDANPRVQKMLSQATALLIDGEVVEAWAIQRRIFALTHRRFLMIATNNRFIGIRRKLFAGFDMTELRWQDLMSAKIKVGLFGADLELVGSTKSDLAMTESGNRTIPCAGFRKEQTSQVYRICQNNAQSWREKRRVRELEEMRAKSGGINLSTMPGIMPSLPNPSPANDVASRLQQLKDLHDKKLINDSEFESSKAKILTGL